MAEAILHAVSKIAALALNREVAAVIEKLSKKVASLRELPSRIKMIEKELKMMNSVIQDLGTTNLSNNVVKGWTANVRKLAYHVEDVIDKYSYEALKLKEDGFLNWHDIRGSGHIKVFSRIVEEVEEIEGEIRHVKKLQEYWTNTDISIQNEHAYIDRKQSGGCFPELVSDVAEAILHAVSKIGAVVLNKEVSAVIEKLSKKIANLREMLEKIKRVEKELRMMNNVIQQFGTVHLSNSVVKGWTTNVRELANHAEVVIDKYSYEALKLKEDGFLNWYDLRGSSHIKVFSTIVEEVVEIEEETMHVKELQNYWSNTVQSIHNEDEEIERKLSGGFFPHVAEAILKAVSKIGAVVLNKEVSVVIEKLSKKVVHLNELIKTIKRIEKELRTMNNVIEEFGTTHLSNNVVKGWTENVRELANHVEVVIDKYSYEALKLKEDGFLNWYDFRGSSHIMVFSIIVDEVVEIEKDIEHVKEMQNYWTSTVQSIPNDDADIDGTQSGVCFPEVVSDVAEAILDAVSKIGAVVLNKEVSTVIEKLSKKVVGLRDFINKIKRIERDLRMMNNVINEFGTTHLSNNVVKSWTAKVRELANHVEVVIDKYSSEALKLKEDGSLNWYNFRVSGHIMVFSIIVDEVLEIEEEIGYVKDLQSYWTNTVEPIQNYCSNTVQFIQDEHAEIDSKQSGGSVPEIVSDEDLVGIDENRRKLTEWLTTDEKESTVIAVSGMGGLGKTALVKNVYDREKANFPGAHAWIVVSQTYDVVDLLAKLLTKIQLKTGQSPPSVDVSVGSRADVFELTEAITKTLQDRKCLIVLDDVWDKEAYHQISGAFQGIRRSHVMITTRKEHVAALAPKGCRLLLQPLGIIESFKLLCSIAFRNNSPARKCPPELEKVAAAVVERCHGLPLAIIYSGNLLSTKPQTEHAWYQMYNHLRSELRKNNHFQTILNLSYHDLPGDLRNCFLYCTLFPQGHPIPRENLVRLWVAEGFTIKKENSTSEEVAEDYLMELIDRNMLQVVERDVHFTVSKCKMHDIVRDLALDVAKVERFGSAKDQGEMMLMDTEVRWFSTCDWTDSNKTAPAGVEFLGLRTFVSIGSSSNMLSSVFSGSIYLTILELEDSPINQLPASIGNLFNLRYIGLRRTQVHSLPDTIDKLSNLETLDIKHTRIEKLPPGIVKVEKLQHLLADRYADEKQTEFRYCVGVEAPKMISNFQELQTLETVHASKDLALELKKMENLQTVCIDNIDASNCEELFCTLSNMTRLSSLLLSASHEKETLSFQDLGLLYDKLSRLIIRGGCARGTLERPIFQGHGSNLKYLALSWCNLETKDPLQFLASHLQGLTYLSLNRVSSEGILVLPAGCFPLLKTLVLKRMPGVKQLAIEERSIQCIDGLYITTLLGLTAVPNGIESLSSLTRLWMLDLHMEFKADWIQNQMDYKMNHVADLRV